MSPRAFSAAVLPHGVTTVVSEPHEIANVFGLDGVRESLRAAGACALDIRLAMPSSAPSARPIWKRQAARSASRRSWK